MADIPNTEYITVNANGIFVGGKPATTYRGVIIGDINYVKNIFAWMQEQNSNITELHVLSSETSGEYAMVGNPSTKHGPNAWCRVKYNDDKLGGWVFDSAYRSAARCVLCCASDCAYYVWSDPAFWWAVLWGKPENPEIEKLKAVDFSKLPKSPIKLNGYEIIVRKIVETKQNKR